MNAKKIMGAVLVALLAAALFVGAGAAATDKGTVFINQAGTATALTDLNGTWTNGAYTVNIDANTGAVTSDKFVAGTYKKGDWTLNIKNPAVNFNITGVANGDPYSVGTFYKGTGNKLLIEAKEIQTVVTTGGPDLVQLLITAPNGNESIIPYTFSTPPSSEDITNYVDQIGEYKVKALFNKSGFAPKTLNESLWTAVSVFKVAKATATLSVPAESVVVGNYIKLEITGQPGQLYNITGYDKFTLGDTQPYGADTNADNEIIITLPNDGKAYINLKAADDGTSTLKIKKGANTESTIKITVIEGAVTITTDKDAYFIGDEVKLSGTITGDSITDLEFYIKGPNFDKTAIKSVVSPEQNGDKWTAKLTTPLAGTTMDAGTYTITIEKGTDGKNVLATGGVALKQPFLSITEAPAVAVKDTKYEVKGTAEATQSLYAYVFGTNFFAAGTGKEINTTSGNIGKISVEDNQFTATLNIPKEGMDAGQYFLVIQHPMYDKNYGVAAEVISVTAPTNKNVTGSILKNATGNVVATNVGYELFNVTGRQKTNAAQALCDELDKQDIDDMYVKASFVVAAPLSTISPLPAEITKGSKLTVTGETNMGKGKLVTVELLSTAFAAVPKETVGSASFITVATKTDENGNWVVEFDTSSLNVDEYTVSVAVEGLDSTTAKLNVIEGAPVKPTETGTQPTQTEQPTQPTQTQQPTTPPKTPGFGALAALAGLGAVAVLLLRRE